MTPGIPDWYSELEARIASRFDLMLALYPGRERRPALWAIMRAIHSRASETDGSVSWLAVVMASSGIDGSEMRDGRYPVARSASEGHPSQGDAEDMVEDISLMETPMGGKSVSIALRAAVHVAWTRYATSLEPSDRALLAAEAVSLS